MKYFTLLLKLLGILLDGKMGHHKVKKTASEIFTK